MSEPARPSSDAGRPPAPSTEGLRRGALKVFLGMCAGVGKTYAMLEAGQARRRQGVDVRVGLVETHGRTETETLLPGLTMLPRQRIEHRGLVLEEFDLDLALAEKPELILLDELAHTNAPRARHERRWQDVRELLDAGLDVFTTLNIQHVESLAGAVREITGVAVRETVPDTLLDDATIELVDLPVADLRQRLAEGRVYTRESAERAATHFFREANLIALREMALRYAADHASHDTRGFHRLTTSNEPWRTSHRVMVGIGPSPHSSGLVRATRRLASSLNCPWVAVHVDTGEPLPADAQARVTRHLALARELGAEIVVCEDARLVPGLLRAAHDTNATHLVIGKPGGGLLRRWRGEWNLLRLVRASASIDVQVVRLPDEDSRPTPASTPAGVQIPWGEHALVAALVASTTVLGRLVAGFVGPHILAFVFLVLVVGTALAVGRAAVFTAATLSALAWNFFFLPPPYTLRIHRPEDVILFIGYFVVAALVGQLVHRLRRQELAGIQREARTRALYELTRELAEARTRDEVVWRLIAAVHRTWQSPVAVLVPHGGRDLVPHPDGTLPLDDKELAVATWAGRHSCASGRFTDTLPGATALHIPMSTDRGVAGVLSVRLPGPHPPTVPQRELLEAFARQAALVLDRQVLQADAERGRVAQESDRLGRALLDSVSHELRTPLTALTTAASALASAPSPNLIQVLADEIQQASQRMDHIVGQLFAMSRLESGAIRPQPEWLELRDLVARLTRQYAGILGDRPLTTSLDPTIRFFWGDPRLTEQALGNLLHNAGVHTPSMTPIAFTVLRQDAWLEFVLEDQGPGLSPDALSHLFEKFHPAPGVRVRGVGLGLAIARGFVAAQSGTLTAEPRPGGGVRFILRLPHRDPPVPHE